MIRLRLCRLLAKPGPDLAGTAKCDCCEEDCWISKHALQLYAQFPKLNLLCEECADLVLSAVSGVLVQVPKDDRGQQAVAAHFHAVGEYSMKGGQS